MNTAKHTYLVELKPLQGFFFAKRKEEKKKEKINLLRTWFYLWLLDEYFKFIPFLFFAGIWPTLMFNLNF